MGTMNILAALFGIFRQRGLVSTLKEGRRLTGFAIAAVLLAIIGGGLYGLAMGIGLGIDTAIKDAIKVAIISALVLLLSIPIFWVAYRLLGREERPGQVTAVPLTMVSAVALILALTSPVVFMLSILAGFSPEAVYIHIVIVDLALLVGLYLAGMLIYHGFPEAKGLIVPNAIGFLMMAVILVVLLSFLGPFLEIRPSFSVGTDRLKDGLGIGVAAKAEQSLEAAAQADRVTYRFQTTNENGDVVRDYGVTRVGNDYLIEVHLHAVPGETFQTQRRIWVLDGQYYTDFEAGRVSQTAREELASFLDPALPPAVFTLPPEFAQSSWRAFERGGSYTATGTAPSQAQATLVMDAGTGRLSGLTLGRAERGVHAEVRAADLVAASLDRAGLESTLHQAIVVGDVDRSNAAMLDYVQDEAFFVVRYPRTWRAGSWNAAQRQVEFTVDCGRAEGCPVLAARTYDLAEGKGVEQYAEELGHSLGLQAEYRQIAVSTESIGGETAGVVEYLFDRTVKGQIETTHHLEYIFEGQLSRYHLDFAAPEAQFEGNRALFEEMAGQFTYLKSATLPDGSVQE
jgi:hypothetical protein